VNDCCNATLLVTNLSKGYVRPRPFQNVGAVNVCGRLRHLYLMSNVRVADDLRRELAKRADTARRPSWLAC